MKNKTALKQFAEFIETPEYIAICSSSNREAYIEKVNEFLKIEKEQLLTMYNDSYREAEHDLGQENKTDIAEYDNAIDCYNKLFDNSEVSEVFNIDNQPGKD